MVVALAVEKVADDGLVADRSELCESRIFLYLDSPALVVCEMPVEGVEFVDFHHVDVFLHHVHVEEMSRNVHVHASVSEAWFVLDFNALESPFLAGSGSLSVYLGRKHLLEGLDGVVESVEGRSLYVHAFFAYSENVCLFGKGCVNAEVESVRSGVVVYGAFLSADKRKLSCKSVDEVH